MTGFLATNLTLKELRHEKTGYFAYAKTKTQISFAVSAKLFSAFVFVTPIVQALYFLYTKFQASSHLVWLYSLVCVGPGRKPRRPVLSQRGSKYPTCHPEVYVEMVLVLGMVLCAAARSFVVVIGLSWEIPLATTNTGCKYIFHMQTVLLLYTSQNLIRITQCKFPLQNIKISCKN